jgi:hypothetical protein
LIAFRFVGLVSRPRPHRLKRKLRVRLLKSFVYLNLHGASLIEPTLSKREEKNIFGRLGLADSLWQMCPPACFEQDKRI